MANCGTKQWLGNQEALSGDYHVFALAGNTIGRQPENGGNGDGHNDSGASYTLTKTDVHGVCFQQNTCDEVRLMNGDGQIAGALAANAGMKQQNYLAYSFEPGIAARDGSESRFSVEVSSTLRKEMGDNQVAIASTFKIRGGCEGGGKGYLGQDEAAFTLSTHTDQHLHPMMQVRRLTPLECERLQGFSDNWTNIPGASDSARYKSLGNSMAVNVMLVLGQIIQKAHDET